MNLSQFYLSPKGRVIRQEVGVVWIYIECGCLRGTVGENRYGPDPLGLRII